ncbi:MAG: class I SAM-dependent methyltransferase [Hyphomicrobiales bacterium]|nr:methyltransferase domain-containing protein [Hyphomicrobiales bacterium]MDE2016835.1 class I SAM-dependent methyltransferase [Hyphomicrobiales bacterium]
MDFKDHFSGVARGYGEARPTYPSALARWLGDLAPARGLALECGCGSGQLTRTLAHAFARVVATDASAKQVAAAPTIANVEWRAAPAEASGLPDGSADLVVAAQAAHWFDLPRFYAEARRVGAPGAALALIAYGRFFVAPEIDAAVAAYYDGALGAFWPPERVHPETGYRDLPFPFARIAAPAFSLAAEWDLARTLGYFDTWSATVALKRAKGDDAPKPFYDAISRAWGDPSAVRAFAWPVTVLAARLG